MLTIKRVVTFALALVFLAATGASAASFVVSPIRVFFNKKLSKDKVTIINNGMDDVSLQVTVKEWRQDMSGKSSYHPTKEIIFFPKIFSIAKGEKRVVRLGFKGKMNSGKEMTYRLFVDEIRSKEARKKSKLNLLLKIGVPIFITPDRVREELIIAEPDISKEKISVVVNNRGNTHKIINKVLLEGLKSGTTLFKREKRGWYILNGKSSNYTIDLAADECSSLTDLLITVETKELSVKKEVGVDSGKCGP